MDFGLYVPVGTNREAMVWKGNLAFELSFDQEIFVSGQFPSQHHRSTQDARTLIEFNQSGRARGYIHGKIANAGSLGGLQRS
jgi:hypothetical protein